MTLPALIPRVPKPQSPDSENRLRRSLDLVGEILNSLILSGELHLAGPGTWGLKGLFYAGHGVPPSSLGFTTDYYLDLDAGVLYRKD